MAYQFSPHDESVRSGLRRIAREQINKAVAEIDDAKLPPAETIHQVRKRCKKLRGLIRLVQPAFDAYAQENARIRDAARLLSGARDDDVLIETFDALVAGEAAAEERGDLAGVRERLTARRDANRRRPDAGEPRADERLARFRDEMTAALARVEGWELSGKGFGAIAGGLEKTYRRGRRAFRAARADPSADNIHEWRKRVKYHGYHTRLLAPVWPQTMEAWAMEAGRLGDLLGDHHDLSVFAGVLAKDFAIAGNPDLLETLVRMARARQSELEVEVFGLGARLFADRPEALVKSWRGRWRAWRKEGKAERGAKLRKAA